MANPEDGAPSCYFFYWQRWSYVYVVRFFYLTEDEFETCYSDVSQFATDVGLTCLTP
jgi:hypothetical protein